MELVKENIEYEQLNSEESVDSIIRHEYVIPDTHPDVYKILMLDAKPKIINKELLREKIYIEGQIEYNLLYTTRVDEKNEVYNVNYSAAFSNSIDCENISEDIMCEAECYIEHMDCNIVNERKVCIEGIIVTKCDTYQRYDYQIVKDVEDSQDIQFWKNPTKIDKVIGNLDLDLIGQSHIEIPSDKPAVDKIIKCNINLHKKNVKVLEGKLKFETMANINLIYKCEGIREIYTLEDEILLEKEVEVEKVDSFMEDISDFNISSYDYIIKEDEMGENRIIDIELNASVKSKIMFKEEIDIIEDAYSPSMLLSMDKREYDMNVMHNYVYDEIVVKGDIDIDKSMSKPKKILISDGDVVLTDKRLVEDKVIVDGILRAAVLYKCIDDDVYINNVEEEIPFTCTLDVPGTKINMRCICKASLENMEADVEGGNIALKAIVKISCNVNYMVHKEFVVDICPDEGEIPEKNASIIIYVVQNGDTLWKIAKKYNTTIDELVELNEIEDEDNLKIGTKLIIPGRAII